MPIQEIRNSTLTVGGSLTFNIQSQCQGASCTSSQSTSAKPSLNSVSNLVLGAERLQQSAKELDFELKLTTGSPVEYNDLATSLDDIVKETIRYVFGFLLQGFRLDRLRYGRALDEIARMQEILDLFAKQRAVDCNEAIRAMKCTTIIEAICGILWVYFYRFLYSKYIIRSLRRSLSGSHERICVILSKPMASLMYKSVRCHRIEIDDFFGAQWSLPQDLCYSRQVFLSVLRFKFQDGPAEDVILSEQFGVFGQDDLRAIQASDWENAMKKSGSLQLSVLVGLVDRSRALECPRCKRSDKSINGFDGWANCLRCNLTFNIILAPDSENHVRESDSLQASIVGLADDSDVLECPKCKRSDKLVDRLGSRATCLRCNIDSNIASIDSDDHDVSLCVRADRSKGSLTFCRFSVTVTQGKPETPLSPNNFTAESNDILSWTNQDPRESLLFNSWGVMYRFQTDVSPNGQSVTTLWRILRPNKEERAAKLAWSANGGLGRIAIGKNVMPMVNLATADAAVRNQRSFLGPDGVMYRWRPSTTNQDIVLVDGNNNIIAFYRPIRPTRYQIGDVYGELHFLRTAGAGTVLRPQIMDYVTVTIMLYRFCAQWNL